MSLQVIAFRYIRMTRSNRRRGKLEMQIKWRRDGEDLLEFGLMIVHVCTSMFYKAHRRSNAAGVG